MSRKLLNVFILLQSGTGNVEREIGAVKASLEQEQKIGDDLFDVVRNEDLMVVYLDPSLKRLVNVVGLWEI